MKTEIQVPVKIWHPNRLIQYENGVILYTATHERCGVVVSPATPEKLTRKDFEFWVKIKVGHIFHPQAIAPELPYSVLPSGTTIKFMYEDE